MTASKNWDKHDIIMRASRDWSTVAKNAAEGREPNKPLAIEAAAILVEILLQDVHRIAAALERIADTQEDYASWRMHSGVART